MTCKDYWETPSHQVLESAAAAVKLQHLRKLLKDEKRNKELVIEAEGMSRLIQTHRIRVSTLLL